MSNDHQNLKFRTDIGINATVQRETMKSEDAAGPNRRLIDLGLSFQQGLIPHLEHYRYFGSAAVHIYFNETLRQLDFISQTKPLELYHCPQPLAAKSFDDLLGEMKQMYGQRRGKLRSGF